MSEKVLENALSIMHLKQTQCTEYDALRATQLVQSLPNSTAMGMKVGVIQPSPSPSLSPQAKYYKFAYIYVSLISFFCIQGSSEFALIQFGLCFFVKDDNDDMK